jgi:hypothetical protein
LLFLLLFSFVMACLSMDIVDMLDAGLASRSANGSDTDFDHSSDKTLLLVTRGRSQKAAPGKTPGISFQLELSEPSLSNVSKVSRAAEEAAGHNIVVR